MKHPLFPAVKLLPYGVSSSNRMTKAQTSAAASASSPPSDSVDPVSLLINAVYSELADVFTVMTALGPAASVIDHAFVRELFVWITQVIEFVNHLLGELLTNLLPSLRLPAPVLIACRRNIAEANTALDTFLRSRQAFTPSLPAGERLPVLMRAAARLRIVITGLADVHTRVLAAMRSLSLDSQFIHAASSGSNRRTSRVAASVHAKKPRSKAVDLVQVETDTWRRLVSRRHHRGRVLLGVAMATLLTRWMTKDQLRLMYKRHARGINGVAVAKLLRRARYVMDGQHRYIPLNIDKIIANERAEVQLYNASNPVTREQWVEATRLSRLYAEQVASEEDDGLSAWTGDDDHTPHTWLRLDSATTVL